MHACISTARKPASQPQPAREAGASRPCHARKAGERGTGFRSKDLGGAVRASGRPARLLPYTTVQAVVLVRVVTLSWQKGKKARMAGVGSEEGYGRR
jgi:hypothetical protein